MREFIRVWAKKGRKERRRAEEESEAKEKTERERVEGCRRQGPEKSPSFDLHLVGVFACRATGGFDTPGTEVIRVFSNIWISETENRNKRVEKKNI